MHWKNQVFFRRCGSSRAISIIAHWKSFEKVDELVKISESSYWKSLFNFMFAVVNEVETEYLCATRENDLNKFDLLYYFFSWIFVLSQAFGLKALELDNCSLVGGNI